MLLYWLQFLQDRGIWHVSPVLWYIFFLLHAQYYSLWWKATLNQFDNVVNSLAISPYPEDFFRWDNLNKFFNFSWQYVWLKSHRADCVVVSFLVCFICDIEKYVQVVFPALQYKFCFACWLTIIIISLLLKSICFSISLSFILWENFCWKTLIKKIM